MAEAEAVRKQVRALLERSEAFRALADTERNQMTGDLVKIREYLTELVSTSIEGVFQAVVNSSIEQMRAYAELIASAAKTIDQFAEHHVSDDQSRDHLSAARPKPAQSRQQLLSTMVLMGINRIVVNDGRINARFKSETFPLERMLADHICTVVEASDAYQALPEPERVKTSRELAGVLSFLSGRS